ncbi:MAG: lipid-A-disaccharide synthase [Tenuifilaceae bacterium]|jgi:lipid-A-disaccharide synthase|nr:lipid-A-disaccharide synthase [Bacteroidales bacterium]MDI9516709.1 lipid-A-disaccharide synthase [Bacteroidota bacterium]NLH56174.1 lipid-A-disaccharide synthase [Rikenellaceae bacterium]OQC61005.1 MAG: Lipid-A-disaccharide synthase [Bacteroidetes bacterium ADurb.Bin008]HNV82019.1 lipid-A-disaccharide synthase [Tenuifilaceae bacterium]
MKYYLVAGEASGDLHASNLMQGIKGVDTAAEFRFFGGDLMQSQGGTLVKHYRSMAFMGFWEVIQNLRAVSKNLRQCKEDILSYKPHALILVDYPGFNLRIAKFAKRRGIRVFYYIAPKVWAWKESRVKLLKKYVDKLIVIFPFEVNYFTRHGIDVIYEGNPLVDAIENSTKTAIPFSGFCQNNNLGDKPIIALLAGSRKQEIRYNLPTMISLINHFTDYQFVIAGAPSLEEAVYEPYIGNADVKLIFNQTQELLRHSTAAVVTSGTATLEAALLNVPEVVCYRGNTLSMLIAWIVIRVKYISLVNLIMGREVVKELKQFDCVTSELSKQLSMILPNGESRGTMLSDFAQLKGMLGAVGVSKRIAKAIVDNTISNI